MSTSKVIARFAAASGVGVVFAAVGFAAPAFADNSVNVDLNSVTSNVTAGSRPDAFNVTFRNNTNGAFNIKIVFSVKLPGLTADQVRIVRAPAVELGKQQSGDQVILTDPLGASFLPRSSQNVNYTLQFLSGAPSGRATFTGEALRDNTNAGSASRNITVRGTFGATTPAKTPTVGPTDAFPTGPVATGGVVAGPTITLEPREGTLPASNSGGVPVGLYIMGALLVGVGVAILWLLFRQRSQPVGDVYPTADYDVVPPTLGYPAGRHAMPGNLNPTAAMPSLRAETVSSPTVVNRTMPIDPNTPPPVDPWASQAGLADDALRALGDPPPK
jgi:hypothetical protein